MKSTNKQESERFKQLFVQAIENHPQADYIKEKASKMKNNIRFTRAAGHGHFRCPAGHEWSSVRANVTFDFREKCVAKTWKQGCKKCEQFVHPKFREENKKQIVDDVIEIFLERIEGKDVFNRSEKRGGLPHRQDLCEFCKKLKRPCYG